MGKDFRRKNKTKVAMMGITKSIEARTMVYLSMRNRFSGEIIIESKNA